ncbi:hypothetical protein [Micromonospora parathelypteridis]|uniref:Uncharacterized protein n=1 Tax=Micromonospora parathelypteridis TaxID=1839617 RepID=A0A840VIM5_9ACTN|nr:hypothetical protein [Micromonospora parathelypteridis]MBB5476732.1 hypothetical protein [Micromonospora parathelypteridis]GGO16724.1 hypothetical protein GCM10011576_29890 [Micromonospora parathelypteridis]
MNDLERRYLRLLRAYPADYRRARGAEIVGTYLDLAGPGRRWPSPADAADLLRGGLRQRLRAAGVTDLIPGVRLAALLAMVTASALAGVWGVAELHPPPVEWGVPHLGPFVSLGVVAWAAWLLTAVVIAVAPIRIARLTIVLALLLTLALPPVAAALDAPRPPLLMLLPQAALGLLGLALPDRPSRAIRLAPLLSALLAAATTEFLVGLETVGTYYGTTPTIFLPTVGGLLLVVAALLAMGLALGGDARGGWALVTLLTPAGFLAVPALAGGIGGIQGAVTFTQLAGSAVAVALAGPAVLLLTILARTRRNPATQHTGKACPTCGAQP